MGVLKQVFTSIHDKIEFGKHKGTEFKYIPYRYLSWAIQEGIVELGNETLEVLFMVKGLNRNDNVDDYEDYDWGDLHF